MCGLMHMFGCVSSKNPSGPTQIIYIASLYRCVWSDVCISIQAGHKLKEKPEEFRVYKQDGNPPSIWNEGSLNGLIRKIQKLNIS